MPNMQADFITSPYIIPPVKAFKCETGDPDWPCRLCEEFHDGHSVSPVKCYRNWDKYFNAHREIQHFPGNWLLVQPFLESQGYKLKLQTVHDKGRIASAIYDHRLLYGTAVVRSAHAYPAYGRDGREVFIKMVPKEGILRQELQIWTMLTDSALRRDPRNHTVPIREILHFLPDFGPEGFTPEATDQRMFLVMDRYEPLRVGRFIRPVIRTFEDFVELSRQLVEAVLFLHELGIAHMDLNENNIVYQMVEGRPHYLLLDYQYSVFFPEPWKCPPLMQPEYGVGEPDGLNTSNPFNPFLADVWNLGNLI